MVSVLNFYLDDSGTRYPDRKPGKRAAHGYDWFALGGILIKEADEPEARALYAAFCKEWAIKYPLHSSEIRNATENFLWLEKLPSDERGRFLESLYQLLKAVPVIGLAGVIDRPGYNSRYEEQYGDKPWLLCKTAFSVAVERAAKFARERDLKLRVMPERCNKTEDGFLKGYYNDLRQVGMPFAAGTSGKYAPLSADELRDTLYEFRTKFPSSPMVQLADLYLWPICMGGYNASTRPYKRLLEDGKLIECVLREEDWATRATKYSCFEGVKRKP